jgi:ArsR family transcriptional regulator
MSIQRECCPTDVVADDFSREALLFKALSDPHRLAILATLARAGDEVCVCDFTAGLPLNQPAVSHHLKVLRESGLVTCERRGTWVYYRIAEGAQRALKRTIKALFVEPVPA